MVSPRQHQFQCHVTQSPFHNCVHVHIQYLNLLFTHTRMERCNLYHSAQSPDEFCELLNSLCSWLLHITLINLCHLAFKPEFSHQWAELV